MCTLVNAWLVKEKLPPVQAAVGGGSMASHVCTLANALVVTKKKKHQRKLQVMPTASASEVLVLINGRKTPPAQVAEGQDHLGH